MDAPAAAAVSPEAMTLLELTADDIPSVLEQIRPDLEKVEELLQTQEPISKPRSSRGDEAQIIRKSEPPHVGCYSFERTSQTCIYLILRSWNGRQEAQKSQNKSIGCVWFSAFFSPAR